MIASAPSTRMSTWVRLRGRGRGRGRVGVGVRARFRVRVRGVTERMSTVDAR